MKVMDFDEITRPVAAAKDDTLLLCENTLKSNTRVRLLYNDGTMSPVIEVDSKKLSEKSKQFCTRLLKFTFPTHRFLKVDDLDEIKIMMRLIVEHRQLTPTHAAELLGNVTREQIENLIAEGLLQTSGGNVWLDEVKKCIDEGYIGGIRLVR
jgi:hypothetical protein